MTTMPRGVFGGGDAGGASRGGDLVGLVWHALSVSKAVVVLEAPLVELVLGGRRALLVLLVGVLYVRVKAFVGLLLGVILAYSTV